MTRLAFRLGVAALLSVVVAGCGKSGTPTAKAPAPAVVEAVIVAEGGETGDVIATGRVERRREMALSFRVPGVLTRLSVEAGDKVRAGQVLASLDASAYDAGQRRAAANLERVRRDQARNQALFDQGFVSRQRLDDGASAIKTAQAEYDAATFDRRWANLVSPVTGVVLERTVQSGEVVQPGQAVVRVADEGSALVVRAPISDHEVTRIAVGARASVKAGAAGSERTGRVSRIGELAGPRTGAVEIEIELTGAQDLLSGQAVNVSVAASPSRGSQSGIRLPAEAILEATGQRAQVMIVEPGTGLARRRGVAFNGFDGDDALVAGLAPGARVITAGAGFVGDGEKVTVVDPTRLQPVPGAPNR